MPDSPPSPVPEPVAPAAGSPELSLVIRFDDAALRVLRDYAFSLPQSSYDVRGYSPMAIAAALLLPAGWLGALVGWYFHRHVPEGGSTVLGAILGIGAGAALGWAVLDNRRRRARKSRERAAEDCVRGARSAGGFRVTMTDRTIGFQMGLSMYGCTWFGLRSVREYEAAVVIESWDGMVIPVPNAQLPASVAKEDLLRFMSARMASAGGGEAGFLQRALASRDVSCPRCRYGLRGCDGTRCPECGLPLRSEPLGIVRPRTFPELLLPPGFMDPGKTTS